MEKRTPILLIFITFSGKTLKRALEFCMVRCKCKKHINNNTKMNCAKVMIYTKAMEAMCLCTQTGKNSPLT
jgi:hypothetical protein